MYRHNGPRPRPSLYTKYGDNHNAIQVNNNGTADETLM